MAEFTLEADVGRHVVADANADRQAVAPTGVSTFIVPPRKGVAVQLFGSATDCAVAK